MQTRARQCLLTLDRGAALSHPAKSGIDRKGTEAERLGEHTVRTSAGGHTV